MNANILSRSCTLTPFPPLAFGLHLGGVFEGGDADTPAGIFQ